MDKLREFLNSLSTVEQRIFAISCLTTIGYLRKAISEGQLIKIKTCVKIEQKSNGKVTRKDLRPNDWQENWPELVEAA